MNTGIKKIKQMKYLYLIAAFFMVFFASCGSKGTVTEEHDHEHERVKLKITEYTSHFELFAEADPFVTGETSVILAHFTNLSDFKPLEGAKVNAKLITGDKVSEQTIEKPIKPGIFEFSLKPGKNGQASLLFTIEKEGVNYELVVENLVVYNDENTALHIAEKKVVENPQAINFTKEQSWKVDFRTEWAKKQVFGKVIKTTAQVLPEQNKEFIITAKAPGIVFFEKTLLEGQQVGAGEILLQLVSKDLMESNAGIRYQEVKNNYNLAKETYNRNVALVQNNIVSEKELQRSKAEYENCKALYDNLNKNFNAAGQFVINEADGYLDRVFVENGQYVEAGAPIVKISNNNTLLVKAEVKQKYYSLLKNIYSATIKSTVNNKVYDLNDLQGEVLSYAKNIADYNSYLIPVNFRIKNNGAFLPGSFVDMYIKTKSDNLNILVPNSSIIEEQGNYFVFVQVTPELFEKRQVQIADTDGIMTAISSGVSEGERIVSKGGIIVKLAAVSNSLDPHAGHVH